MVSPIVKNMQKPLALGGHRPLDPHRGVAPGPQQGPLSRPLDPLAVTVSASLATVRKSSGNDFIGHLHL